MAGAGGDPPPAPVAHADPEAASSPQAAGAGARTQLDELYKSVPRLRSFCMLAHVDHGKTTLSDQLISSNGIISTALAGKALYLDCRPDEIERRITMKASTISLIHNYQGVPHVCNLIDSPGHVDFSCEVSTSVRLSDGALVIVDAVDGVCSQTRWVLKQAYREKVRCCVVINKFDLLITRVMLCPEEAYHRLSHVLQEVNAIMESFKAADAITGGQLEAAGGPGEAEDGVEEDEDEDWFSPAKGNVLFACAHDGWGFAPRHFAQRWATKLGWKEATLARCLWGEWYLKMKEHKISKKRPRADALPMCVKFVLEPLWHVFRAAGVIAGEDGVVHDGEERHQRLATICEKLDLSRSRETDIARLRRLPPAEAAAAVLRAWLPLSKAVLDMVVDQLPSPAAAQAYRMPRLLPDLARAPPKQRESLAPALRACDCRGPLMAFVAKMVDTDCLPGTALQRRDVTVAAEEGRGDTAFVAVARVFSGTLRVGTPVTVLQPRHSPGDAAEECTVEQLFMLMGRGVEPVREVPAGNICGIGGLSKHVLKTATLAESADCPGFEQMAFQSGAVIRHSVEPVRPQDLERLRHGLQLLNKADPQVEVHVTETGEHVLCCAGEVHAERCVRDLNDRYAKVEMHVSEPIVCFRETIVKEKKKPITVETADKTCSFSISADELPEKVVEVLERREEALRVLLRGARRAGGGDEEAQAAATEAVDELAAAFRDAGKRWAQLWEQRRVWALGPKQCGTCALFAAAGATELRADGVWAQAAESEQQRRAAEAPPSAPSPAGRWAGGLAAADVAAVDARSASPAQAESDRHSQAGSASVTSEDAARRLVRQLSDSIVAGFDLAVDHGPMCEEPMTGVAFIIHDVTFASQVDPGALGGQVMSAVARGCRVAFEQEGRRLVEPVYKATISGSGDCHGKVYAVLHRRRGEIVDDIPQEGSDAFVVEANLPVVESFGLTQELRVQTSGNAQPTLQFSHWHRIPDDPYFVPRTADEMEDMGHHDVLMAGNLPKKMIDKVRQRKGLLTEKMVVMDGEKMKHYSVSAT